MCFNSTIIFHTSSYFLRYRNFSISFELTYLILFFIYSFPFSNFFSDRFTEKSGRLNEKHYYEYRENDRVGKL